MKGTVCPGISKGHILKGEKTGLNTPVFINAGCHGCVCTSRRSVLWGWLHRFTSIHLFLSLLAGKWLLLWYSKWCQALVPQSQVANYINSGWHHLASKTNHQCMVTVTIHLIAFKRACAVFTSSLCCYPEHYHVGEKPQHFFQVWSSEVVHVWF